ncbi:MAG: hypothetical protein WBA10_08915 [Elainellaceae cyanobacterium]
MTSLRASLSLVVLAGFFAAGCSDLSSSNNTADVASDPPAAEESIATKDDAPAPQLGAPAGIQNLDTTVVPGEHVGPITPTTSRQDLADLFGEERLTDTAVDVGEGLTEAGTEITLSDDETLSILWVDSTQSRVQEVRELGPMWQTPEGIHVGMPLDELQQVAGTFEIYGFGWDYGGTVLLNNSRVAQYDGTLILRLAIDQGAAEAYPQAYQAVIGETPYASTNQGFDSLDPYVSEMIVTLTPFGEF